MTLSAEDLVFKARALAQTHPLTPLAKRFLDWAVADQRTSQPVPEIGIWAGAAMINGYCLRRVEETLAGLVPEYHDEKAPPIEDLDEASTRVAADLRTGVDDHLLQGDEPIVDALDRLIGGEIGRRVEHWKDTIEEKDELQLEEYITWWTVKGYALRAAEMDSGALA